MSLSQQNLQNKTANELILHQVQLKLFLCSYYIDVKLECIQNEKQLAIVKRGRLCSILLLKQFCYASAFCLRIAMVCIQNKYIQYQYSPFSLDLISNMDMDCE